MKTRVIKSIFFILFFVFLMVSTGKLLRYILSDDTESYTRVAFHEMYEQDNIDVLFLGTSHCMHSFDPKILDERLNKNTFNAASSSQALDGSLMLLKEAAKYNDIEHVYLDLFYNSSYDVRKERSQMTSAYIISDYLKPSLTKAAYLLKASGSEHYANSFIVARRYWKKLFEPGYVSDLMKKKNTPDYREYGYKYITHENSEYTGKGYIKNLPEVKDWDFFDVWGCNPVSPDTFSQDYKDDLLEIIDFCKKNGIGITFINAPTSDFCLTAVGDYDDYVEWVRGIAKENGIEYYDFNLCREKYFPSSSEVFIDPVHLNHKGAQILDGSFAALVNKEVAYEDMFYDSYGEKLRDIEPTVFGVTFMNSYGEDGSIVRNCRIVSNAQDELEYSIMVLSGDGNESILRDYSDETAFTMDPEMTGSILIKYRKIKETDGSVYTRKLTLPKN